ncbi:GrpB family protein [Paenibacillus puerhi]|uniref:GrpB family protein n=1 Tax=Paenibacillus puerhi TaxID=2692622 RepID=UPI0013588659|nr:GrpB family protein [Paenibacillus puerhi]
MAAKPVIIEDYNYDWPGMFEELALILKCRLGKLIIDVQHVGSTSVPGLAAKPIIDMDIVISSMSLLPEVIIKLSELGYYHEGNLGVEGREAFGRKDAKVPYNEDNQQKPEHHLYVCNQESEAFINHVMLRDILRRHTHLVDEYGELKKKLAIKYRDNRQAYTEGKTQFVSKVMKEYKIDL